jgi:hypothetical protein
MLHPGPPDTKQILLIRWLLVLGAILVLALIVALIANGRSSGIEGYPAQATETPDCPPGEVTEQPTPSQEVTEQPTPSQEVTQEPTPTPAGGPSGISPADPSRISSTEIPSEISPVCPTEPPIETSPEIPAERASAPPK